MWACWQGFIPAVLALRSMITSVDRYLNTPVDKRGKEWTLFAFWNTWILFLSLILSRALLLLGRWSVDAGMWPDFRVAFVSSASAVTHTLCVQPGRPLPFTDTASGHVFRMWFLFAPAATDCSWMSFQRRRRRVFPPTCTIQSAGGGGAGNRVCLWTSCASNTPSWMGWPGAVMGRKPI